VVCDAWFVMVIMSDELLMKCRIQILHSDPLVFGVVFGLRHGGGEF
jgi:hypothetical protein